METVVDFPEPFGPSRPSTPPGSSVKETPRTAGMAEYYFVSARASSTRVWTPEERQGSIPPFYQENRLWGSPRHAVELPHSRMLAHALYDCSPRTLLGALGGDPGRAAGGGTRHPRLAWRKAMDAGRRSCGRDLRRLSRPAGPAGPAALFHLQPDHARRASRPRRRDVEPRAPVLGRRARVRHGRRPRARARGARAHQSPRARRASSPGRGDLLHAGPDRHPRVRAVAGDAERTAAPALVDTRRPRSTP